MRFDEVNLDENVLQGIEAMNFQEMTPVQEQTIPVILEGKDIIGCAQTGTGKTAAYTLPLLSRLVAEGNPDNHIRAVIMVPTRELAQQIDMQFEGFSYFLPISTTVVYGGGDGAGWDQQKKGLLMGADVVIATPGRLLSHIANSGIDLSQVSYFILDEADRMLDMGFFDDIMQIVKQMPTKRQTILFSATLPPKIRQLAKQILKDPAEIIIFSSSKQKVKDLAYSLKRMKLNVAAMHSDLEQEQREAVMLDFKNGKTDILVATDIVARGIDIDDIGLVINYDVPHDPEDYIHRIGRTARANADGVAITFVCEPEQGKFHKIEEFIEKDIYKIPLPPTVGPGPVYNPQAFERRPRGKFKNNRPGRKRPYTRKKNFNKPEN